MARSYFGQQIGTERKSVAIQRWEVAATVYRFTLGEPLPPGEYALAEILPDGMNLFVWDFGVDPSAPANPGSWTPRQPAQTQTGTNDTPVLEKRPPK